MEISKEIIAGLVEAGNKVQLFKLASQITEMITVPLLFVMFLPAVLMLIYGLLFIRRKTENYWIILFLIFIAPIVFFMLFPRLIVIYWLNS